MIDATGNPGVVPRNEANRQLLLAAAHTEAAGADPAVLLWEPPAAPQIDRDALLALAWATADASVTEALDEARRGR